MVHITTPADEFGPAFGPILPVPVDIPTGWECPRCKRVYSPQTGQCVPCSPPPQSFTGPLPRPKPGLFPFGLAPGTPILPVPVDEPGSPPEPRRHGYTFGGFPVTPREPGPMCKCSPVPAAEPWQRGVMFAGPPPGGPWACCVCGSLEVAYRNYADLPFCRPCANGEPLGNLKPCPPAAEGGMCANGEPDDSARSTITPPAYLIADPNGVRLVRLTGDWAEIFTGMQARFLDEGRIQADVEFRLTPADGETGD
jgi:hypothetical protein